MKDYVLTVSQPDPSQQFVDTPKPAMTRADAAVARPANCLYVGYMQLLERDAEIMRYVARFGALTTSQIRELLFHTMKSPTSCTRRLAYLTGAGMLDRVSVRLPSNIRGGSPMGCYQIGRKAWKQMYGTRPYKLMGNPAKLLHTLAIGDVFIGVKQLERHGVIQLMDYETEPRVWIELDGVRVRPDLYVEVGHIASSQLRGYWFEVDRSSEGRLDIMDKLSGYKYAYANASKLPLGGYPQIVFVGKDEHNAATLKRWIKPELTRNGLPDSLVEVRTMADFAELLRA